MPAASPARCRTLARSLAAIVGAALAIVATDVAAADAHDPSAAALRADYAAHRGAIASSPFGKPLVLESSERDGVVAGDVHAVMDLPFDRVRTALADVGDWCEILLLHPNIDRCRIASTSSRDASVAVEVGKARIAVQFDYRLAASEADFLHVELRAPDGPFGTTDYRIELEAAPLDAAQTIVHFAFSHGYGTRARLAMQAYLATFGRGKVGFTVVGRDADGRPRYVDDFRGALERNVMRYYAAIDAYVGSLAAPRGGQREARLRAWWAYTKRYPLQLHEDREYLDRKQAELALPPDVVAAIADVGQRR